MIAAELKPTFAKEAKERQRQSPGRPRAGTEKTPAKNGGPLPEKKIEGEAREAAANAVKVAPAYVSAAERVQRTRPDLAEKVKAAEIKIRAERRAGEILAEVERTPAQARDPRSRHRDANAPTYAETIKNSGIAEPTARRWQAEASIPEPVFNLFVAQTKHKGKELTSEAVVSLARTIATHAAVA